MIAIWRHFYEVKVIALRQQVRRNPKRFPKDFVFAPNELEAEGMVSQSVIPSRKVLGGARPLAFTEQGIAMLSSVLTSDRAIEVNLVIMRTFVRMRRWLVGQEELATQVNEIAWKQGEHSYQIQDLFDAIQRLVDPPLLDELKRQMGF